MQRQIEINDNLKFAGGDRVQWEFNCITKYLKGNGVDVGCGTNRLSLDVLGIDQQKNKNFAHADIVHDCKDLEIEPFTFKDVEYTFKDDTLDYIFSSHCLEDFEDIKTVFSSWWKKLRADGLMLLLLPDMEGGRYPKVDDAHGNPSHRTNVGKAYIENMLKELGYKYEMLQCDTLPHDKTCSIDFVIKKTGGQNG